MLLCEGPAWEEAVCSDGEDRRREVACDDEREAILWREVLIC